MDGSGWTTHPGLTSGEARARLAEHGPNEIPERKPPHIARRVLAQLANPLVYVLLGALGLQIALWIAEGAREVPLESIAIAALLALNAGLGAAQEAKADNALAGLRRLSKGFVSVMRDGVMRDVPSREIVPGDLFRLAHGARVPADGRLESCAGVAIDESLTTGESIPIEKAEGDEVTSGTLVVRGTGMVLALRTGSASSTGALAASMSGIVADKTPLERRLRALGDRLAWSMAALVVVLVVAGVAAGGVSAFGRMLLFGAALAVAAVPEGLPAAATLTLALGVKRMAARRAVVRKLSAVETLGSVTVIATDKTGTLTENHIRVARIEGRDERGLLRAMVVANDAMPNAADGSLDAALLEEAARRGIDVAAVRGAPRLSARPFDSAWKFMRVTAKDPDALTRSWLKGAPEVLLARSTLEPHDRARLEADVERHAREGLRVVAFARGDGEAEEGLEFLGFALLDDPPRAEVSGSIRTARAAGIRVVMMTGDHPETARAIARQVGIDAGRVVLGAELDALSQGEVDALVAEAGVFARVRPAHKLLLVDALKRRGEIVAMTGDGVNDAPALKRSDVGIAMGKRGSDVARDVADIVLADDDFSSIVAAVEEGRNAYRNIQTFIRFTLASNAGLVVVMLAGAIAALFGASAHTIALPLTALQLLWINFLGDGPPALALVLDRHTGVMTRPPRKGSEGAFDRASLRYIGLVGLVNGAIGASLWFGMPLAGLSAATAQTALFLFSSIAKLVSVFAAREVDQGPSSAGGRRDRNLVLWGVIVASVGLQVATALIAPLRSALEISSARLSLGFAVVAAAVALNSVGAWIIARRA